MKIVLLDGDLLIAASNVIRSDLYPEEVPVGNIDVDSDVLNVVSRLFSMYVGVVEYDFDDELMLNLSANNLEHCFSLFDDFVSKRSWLIAKRFNIVELVVKDMTGLLILKVK